MKLKNQDSVYPILDTLKRLGRPLTRAWSPDGHRLVFVKGSDLYVAIDGTDVHKLIICASQIFHPGLENRCL